MIVGVQTTVLIMINERYIYDKTGETYEVICIANQGADLPDGRKEGFPVIVVYKDSKGLIWAQREDDFISKFTRVSRYPNKQCRSLYQTGIPFEWI